MSIERAERAGELFCPYLAKRPWGRCKLLEEQCFRMSSGRPCALKDHYEHLTIKEHDPPLTKKLKKALLSEVIKKWKEYAARPQERGRGRVAFLTGRPLEDCIYNLLQDELRNLGVRLGLRKRIEILGGIGIVPDIIISKEGKPTTFIAIKTWVGSGDSVRDIMMIGHFLKREFGERYAKVYAIVLISALPRRGSRLSEEIKKYIDGLYFIDQEPYIDDLIREIKSIYS